MRETAEERARRLFALQQMEQIRTFMNDGVWVYEMAYYEQMLDDICGKMIDEVCDEPTVSLVKKYSKGSFKFV